MANYVYCPFCKSTNIAKASLNDGSEIDVVCYRCKKTIRETLSRRTCKVCGNVLYYPAGMSEVQLPCAPRHEREPAEQQPQPDAASDDAPEMPADQTPDAANDDAPEMPADQTPDAASDDAPEMPADQTPDAASDDAPETPADQKLDVIEWDNSDGALLVHVDQFANYTKPGLLLVVAENQYVVYDGEGTRKILPPRMYSLFRSEFSQKEMLTLIRITVDLDKLIDDMRNQGLTLGFGTRLIFFDERKFEFDEVCRFDFPEEGWSLTVPVQLSMQMNRENAENLMNVGLDFSDDRKATDQLKRLAFREYSQILSRHLTACASNGALKALYDPVEVIAWVKDVFSVKALQGITEAASAVLKTQYGISLPVPIRVNEDAISATPLYSSVEVTSPPPCDHVNRIWKPDFDARKPFTCATCGKKLRWCPYCGGYVTTERLANVCDPRGHRIY